MATAKSIRSVLISAADWAVAEVPKATDTNFRARAFVAQLCGELAAHDEAAMAAALGKVLGGANSMHSPADGA